MPQESLYVQAMLVQSLRAAFLPAEIEIPKSEWHSGRKPWESLEHIRHEQGHRYYMKNISAHSLVSLFQIGDINILFSAGCREGMYYWWDCVLSSFRISDFSKSIILLAKKKKNHIFQRESYRIPGTRNMGRVSQLFLFPWKLCKPMLWDMEVYVSIEGCFLKLFV